MDDRDSLDQQGLEDFWSVYQAHYDEIRDRLWDDLMSRPESQGLPDPPAEEVEAERALMRAAIIDGQWEPYLSHLRSQGVAYAQMGLSFDTWFELARAVRPHLLPHLVATYGEDRARLLRALGGLEQFLSVALQTIGASYLDEHSRTIAKQQEAIRELSNPVLQLREGLLLLPVIGVVDSVRSRQLTEGLLHAIRDYRGRVVVIDITGVPEVDSEVANRLVQTADATRLMGATPIVTGLSPGVAQALVTLGVQLGALETVADLEAGMERADEILGYALTRRES